MTDKIYRLFEYVYLFMAGFAIFLVITNWETDRNRAYLFLFFTVVAIFMFFFKRRFRKNIEKRRRGEDWRRVQFSGSMPYFINPVKKEI